MRGNVELMSKNGDKGEYRQVFLKLSIMPCLHLTQLLFIHYSAILKTVVKCALLLLVLLLIYFTFRQKDLFQTFMHIDYCLESLFFQWLYGV